jgi:spore coat polysaccharide biosynthesis predicted glycosyltransferase SpsG
MLAFSIEASHKRGMGHLYRSITISKYLGYESIFFINKNLKSLEILKRNKIKYKIIDRKKKINFKNLVNKYSVKIWINDKLETNKLEGQKISSLVSFVTFDDWGKGSRFAKLNISPLYFGKKKLSGKKVFTGIKYLPLKKETFKYARTRKKINKILISMGGSDTYNVTLKILDYLKKKNITSTVICGPTSKLNNVIKKYKKDFKIKYNVKNIFKEFSNHDILICGGGMTPFEAASTGLPSIVIASEPFEIPVCKKLQKIGISKFIGYRKKINFKKIDLNLDINKMSNTCINRIKMNGLKNIKKNIDSLLR